MTRPLSSPHGADAMLFGGAEEHGSVVPFTRRSVPAVQPPYAALESFTTPADIRPRHHAQPFGDGLGLPPEMFEHRPVVSLGVQIWVFGALGGAGLIGGLIAWATH